jgi:hypothetical protein
MHTTLLQQWHHQYNLYMPAAVCTTAFQAARRTAWGTAWNQVTRAVLQCDRRLTRHHYFRGQVSLGSLVRLHGACTPGALQGYHHRAGSMEV